MDSTLPHSLTTQSIPLDQAEVVQALFGSLNCYQKELDQAFGVHTLASQEGIRIQGDSSRVERAAEAWKRLIHLYEKDGCLDERTVHLMGLEPEQTPSEKNRKGSSKLISNSVEEVEEQDQPTILVDEACLLVSAKGRPVRARTVGQKTFISAVQSNELVFAIGPAGTGKTYLAVAMAVRALKSHQVSRIILTRPAVEAGEKLGFLPGDLQMKVDPYMSPLYDALYDFLGVETFNRMMERGEIEISPLAYMRGRTLDDAFIILDEAQNTTPEQIKMFLTRIGFHSRTIITGDITQVDLPRDKKSGLLDIQKILGSIDAVSFVRLETRDVVRNPLVQRIIRAYEQYDLKWADEKRTGLQTAQEDTRKSLAIQEKESDKGGAE